MCIKIHDLGIMKSNSTPEKGEAQKSLSSEKQIIWYLLSEDLKGMYRQYGHWTQQTANS